MTIGSLFSGIGGLERGLEDVGLGPVMWQVEIDEWCRGVLARHWPDVVRYEDVRAVCTPSGVRPETVDVICGGFPCQDIADTQGAGLDGPRSGLWFEMLRVVRELRPRVVVVENVSALALRGLDRVLAGLAACGYDAEWSTLRSCDLGQPHRRARAFVLAYANPDGRIAGPKEGLHVRWARWNDAHGRSDRVPGPRDDEATWRAFRSSGGPEPGIRRGHDGFPTRMDRRRLSALGNAVDVRAAQAVGLRVKEILST